MVSEGNLHDLWVEAGSELAQNYLSNVGVPYIDA